jgi:GNAT superfamily N-acetyltransferase
MPLVVEPGWVGRRVSVRTAAGTGPTGRTQWRDVVGDLLDVTADHALVEDRDGIVEIPLAEVAAARVAPPSTADELTLEAVAARGWQPDEVADIGGWLLRAAQGFTGRANSVLPLRAPGMPLEDALAAAREWYAARGLPLRLQIPTEARRLLDAELGERGWPASPHVAVMAARLDAVTLLPAGDVDVADRPDEGWLARYRDGAGRDEVAQRVLTRHDTVAFASVTRDGETVAIGRGVVDAGAGGADRWLGVSAVEVVPEHRRTCLARAVVAALRDWAAARGATRAYLQVSSDNDAALALYRSIGFWHHHDYRYRTDPGRSAG